MCVAKRALAALSENNKTLKSNLIDKSQFGCITTIGRGCTKHLTIGVCTVARLQREAVSLCAQIWLLASVLGGEQHFTDCTLRLLLRAPVTAQSSFSIKFCINSANQDPKDKGQIECPNRRLTHLNVV